MKKLILPAALLVLFTSCMNQKPTDVTFYNVERSDFDHIMNTKKKTTKNQKIDLADYKTILNRDYPIEIALFDDGTWHYDLPNLEEGSGTWKFEAGNIRLFAERPLFDIHINVVATAEKAAKIAIEFSDRHGYNVLPTEKINLE